MLLRVDRRWRSRSFPNTPCTCHQLATCPRRGQHLPASDGSSEPAALQLPCCPGRTQRSSACFALFEQPNLAPNFLPRIPGGHSSSDHVVLPGSRQRSGKFPRKGRLPLRLCGGQKRQSCFCWSKHPNHQNVFY